MENMIQLILDGGQLTSYAVLFMLVKHGNRLSKIEGKLNL